MCLPCSSRKWKGASSIGSLLTKDVRPEYHHDLDYLISMLDWEANVNPEFAKTNKTHPTPVRPVEEMEEAGYREMWITYGTPLLLGQRTDRAAQADASPSRMQRRTG